MQTLRILGLFLSFLFIHCGAPVTEEGKTAQKAVASQPSTGLLPPAAPSPAPTPGAPAPAPGAPGQPVADACATDENTLFSIRFNGTIYWNETECIAHPSMNFNIDVFSRDATKPALLQDASVSIACTNGYQNTMLNVKGLTAQSNRIVVKNVKKAGSAGLCSSGAACQRMHDALPYEITIDSIDMKWICTGNTSVNKIKEIYKNPGTEVFPANHSFNRPTP